MRTMLIVLLSVVVLCGGCESPQTVPAPQAGDSATQPDDAVADTQPDTAGVAAAAGPAGDSPRAQPSAGSAGAVIEIVGGPANPADPQQANVLGLPVGQAGEANVEFTMPGKGFSPMVGVQADSTRNRQAAAQAALAVAIYNVTKEVNPQSHRDEIENGYVSSDHFRYRDGQRAGLEVKSQTIIAGGRIKQFDVWLIVPGEQAEPPRQLHVRNHRLVGDPLDSAGLARMLASTGGRLFLSKISGPDHQGAFAVEVGLIRKPKHEQPATTDR